MRNLVRPERKDKPPMALCNMGHWHPKPHKYERESWRTDDMHGTIWHESCRVCGNAPGTVGFCRQ